MKTKLHSYSMNLSNLPPLTDEQRAELAVLATLPDEQIDYSDIPPLTEAFWKNAVQHSRLYRPTKSSTTVRLDSDVLEWFKAKGKGYQTRMNAALRETMMRELNKGNVAGRA